ncbi:hypothetical protein KAU11_05305, partial [Candidatus Babeliales bacterium]|nr:hypothetical protein [Candidatus Babeliales bacterium]
MTVEREKSIQGSAVRLYHYFTASGILTDPDSITSVTIKDSNDVAVTTLTPTHIRTGVYVCDWEIGSAQAAGAYIDEWIAVGVTPTTQSGDIEVHNSNWDFVTGELSEVTSGVEGMAAKLSLMLGMFGDIAVYDEEALLDAARTKAITTYRFWRYDRPIFVRIGNTVQSAYYVDYGRGEIK